MTKIRTRTDESDSMLGSDAQETPVWPVIVVMFLYSVAIFTTMPVFPFIWTTTTLGNNDEVKGASLHAWGAFTNALAEFLSASVLGVLSDRFGRKPFILLASIGQIIDFGVAGYAANDRDDYSLSFRRGAMWMFGARWTAGLCGNMAIFVKAYVADISTPENSSKRYAMLAACVGSSIFFGPALGGVLSSRYGFRCPMMVAAGMNVANLFLAFMLPESLSRECRVPVNWRQANPCGLLSFLWSSHFLCFFAAMAFLDQFAVSIVGTVFMQYHKIVFGVSRSTLTLMMIVYGGSQIFTLGILLRPLVSRVGDVAVLKVGYSITCIGFGLLALISYPKIFWLTWPVIVWHAFGSMSGPTQTAIATRCVSRSEQGKLQAANGSLDVVGKMSANGLVGLIFKPVIHMGQPGLLWWLACLVMLPGVWIAFNIKRFLPPDYKEGCNAEDSTEDDEDSTEEDMSTTLSNASNIEIMEIPFPH